MVPHHRFNGIDESVAKRVAKSVAKRAMIMVAGYVHYSKWTDANGTDRYGGGTTAKQVDFLAKAKQATKEEPRKRCSN